MAKKLAYFLPKKIRIILILQLCIAFTLLAYQTIVPLITHSVETKTLTNLMQEISGNSPSLNLNKAKKNHERFLKLPSSLQTLIIQEEKNLHSPLKWPSKRQLIKESINNTQFYLKAWIFFSIVISF